MDTGVPTEAFVEELLEGAIKDSTADAPEETSDYSSPPEAPMQRRREREGAQRAPKQAATKLKVRS